MTELVGAIGVPHTPAFPTMVEQGAPLADELRGLYGELAERLDRMAPDVLIYFTSDHYNTFFETSLPIFAIGVAESTSGPADYTELTQYTIPVAGALASRLQERLVRAGFDIGKSQEFSADHPITIPLHFIRPTVDVPIVPIFINAFVRPLPSAERCLALGRAVREALNTDGEYRRAVAVATGSFSLEVGGPRIGETSHIGVPDRAWVERILELLRAGDVDALAAEATQERIDGAGNAGGEVLDWIALLGLLGPGTPDYLEVQWDFGHAYAVWSANA
jgi:aromatic ring-opening dioxygenase catalytic subunit (LigB family)